MNKIFLSAEAQNDLKEIRQYITEELNNPAAAESTLVRITRRIRTLADFAEIGSSLFSVVGSETAYRFLICGNYLVFYRTEKDSVFVDRILYGRRDYLRIFLVNCQRKTMNPKYERIVTRRCSDFFVLKLSVSYLIEK